jgi:hypothetical protein
MPFFVLNIFLDDGNGKSLGSSSKQNSVDELVEQPPPPNSNEQQPSKA